MTENKAIEMRDRAYAILRKHEWSVEDAEDLAQEIVLYLLEHPQETPNFGIVYCRARDAYHGRITIHGTRRWRNAWWRSISREYRLIHPLEDRVELQARDVLLLRALLSISPRQRQIAMLSLDGLNNAEIARALQVTEANISKTLKRAIKNLRHPSIVLQECA